jgi:hypothetical protein
MELFLVRARDHAPDDASQDIADHAARHGGLILMATESGSLIIGMPPGTGKETLERHPQVGFVGGVTLNDRARGARALKQQFAINAARQLAAANEIPAPPAPAER